MIILIVKVDTHLGAVRSTAQKYLVGRIALSREDIFKPSFTIEQKGNQVQCQGVEKMLN